MRDLSIFSLVLALCLACSMQASGSVKAGEDSGVSRALLDIHERLHQEPDGRGIFPGTTIFEPRLVETFYQSRGYQPAWIDATYAQEMLQLLKSSEDEGLNPADYHYEELLALREEYRKAWSDKDSLRAQAEVLLTDGIVLYARHLIQGKVDPRTLDASWNYARRDIVPAAVAEKLAAAIASRRVAQVLAEFKPDTGFYALMKQQLQHYRQLAAREQFSPVPAGLVLRPGDRLPNILPLRRRLKELSYLALDVPETDGFDASVEEAIRQLQRDHDLDVDGVVGEQSFQVLNQSFSDKVDRLRINMDRLRWISQAVSDDFIVVNIAGYELYYMRNRDLVWETPVMVGTIKTRTPVFQAPLRYLEFNPTWNTPRSLIVRSLFPKFKANPQYVLDKDYKLYDGKGAEVEPMSIDWDAYTARTFPYRVVQMPGPDNAMGRVKFMFPNQHAVYLHDTPSRDLFSRSQRAFSAGCIRVKNPLELARVLLDDPKDWSAERIQSLLDSGEPQRVVRMQRNVDVLLMYWTVSPTTGGRLQFHHDIYALDPAALAALDAAPTPSAFVDE
jgi:murein L,D-transpeptidase YcbB/YkuD